MSPNQLLPLLLPFAAAILFPIATLALKRAMDLTKDPWGAMVLSNEAVAILFLPFLFMTLGGGEEGEAASVRPAWAPFLAAGLFLLAQVAAYLSFKIGDLTVAVPVQGSKVLMVAGLTLLLLGQDVDWKLWAAAGLTVVAIALLQDRGEKEKGSGRMHLTLALAVLASSCFAAFDVLVQKWSPAWGGLRFAAWAFLIQGALSLGLLSLPGRRLGGYGPVAWRWLALGTGIMAAISLVLVLVISLWGKATQVNILFNSRCVASVLVIWLAGRLFGNREAEAGKGVMLHRLLGAGCMMAAVVLALFSQ